MTIDILALKRYNSLGVVFWRRSSIQTEKILSKRTREPLNQSAAALSGSFAPTFRFENLEIRKVFLQFSNLNLEQNP